MSVKRWVLGKVHGSPAAGRRVAPSVRGELPEGSDAREPMVGDGAERADGGRGTIAHLGPYAPLIAAIREELEHFVESHVRLHLAIAERDRYVLTSIDVDCEAHGDAASLLGRFVAEFKPEQIKRFLARDVIAGLRNASAIDLTQFAGLNDARALRAPDEKDPYHDLIADLQKGAPGATPRAFTVTLVGRWSQADALASEGGPARARSAARPLEGAHTPLAGRSLQLDIEDARGARRVELASIVPGRRYAIGKEESSDVPVDGVYTSRRHCEIWFERDAWWVIDAGSTNGIRVEAQEGVTRGDSRGGAEPIEVPAGAMLVLSAFAQGEPRLYPRLRLQPVTMPQARAADGVDISTLATPIAPARPRDAAFTIAAHMASGVREVSVAERSLPLGIGRSRNQALVIDGAHADVSGRHLEIVALDEQGASVVVHGDNGVTVDGVAHGPGAKFVWKRGQDMRLGRGDTRVPACTLTLSRPA